MAQDDFEFDAVPKYMDFRNDENDDGALHDRSAFFHGDEPIHPTPHKPRTDAPPPPLGLLNDPAKAKKTPPAAAAIEKIPVPAVLAEKNTFQEEEEQKKKMLPGCTSDLALFNPGISRVKERARRRSQQIQVKEEVKPPAAPVSRILSTRRSATRSPPKNLPFARSREAAERNRQPLTRPHPIPAAAEQKNLGEKKKQPLGANSNLALFNPAASRLQERARRRSQQIQVKEDPPKPAPKNVLRRPTPSTPPQNQAFASSRELEARVQASVERLSAPKNRQLAASDAQRSANGTPKKTAQPISRRPSASSNLLPPKTTPEKPEAFKQKLRSYKPPTGKTPAKHLTVPQPYHFQRSRSQCRDADSKPFKIDPKIRDSVNRLSAPKKRESAIGAAPAALRRK